MKSAYAALQEQILAAIEEDLQRSVASLDTPNYAEMHRMISYHMGWLDAPHARGKRVRPLLTLLSCASVEGIWQTALPAASAIELLHNFSLIHDDIEDQSEMRRGRPTLWSKWGTAQAINTGDAVFTLAHLSMLRLSEKATSSDLIQDLMLQFDRACLSLTQGQHLDIGFETRSTVSSSEYLTMIEGKTAALLAASTAIGARIGEAEEQRVTHFGQFGRHLGLAFQILDDVLGIWGEPARTGKSHEDDIRSRKKTLPVLFAMEASSAVAEMWNQSNELDRTGDIVDALEKVGAREYSYTQAREHTRLALAALDAASPTGPPAEALRNLTHELLSRDQ
ncbi:MAG: polyprenyl synthetase family protein [Anaerolineales bacterium]|jgi:geranylgeranyl diphosphate synthase type I